MRILALSILLAGLPAAAQSLQGKVIDRATLAEGPAGKGVAGAKVAVYDTSGKRLFEKTTARSGAWRFARLKPGRYVVAVQGKGWLPAPMVRVFDVAKSDTASSDFYLDRLPAKNGAPTRGIAKKKSGTQDYYARLAQCIVDEGRHPAFFREAAEPFSIGGNFDATDTTESYRRLWSALAWTEIESQNRPVASRVFLAHALDSALKAAGWPVLPALKPYLKVRADSMEALSLAVRGLILSPSKKKSPADIAAFGVPKGFALDAVEEALHAPGIPPAKKKAFLARAAKPEAAKVYPQDMLKRLAAELQSKPKVKRNAKAAKDKAAERPAGPPSFDSEALWKVVLEQAAGKARANPKPNPVALYHVGYRNLQQGKAREALADIKRAEALRHDYGRALLSEADCHLMLGDVNSAQPVYDSLSRLEEPEWQARGFQGLAYLQWKSGRPEDAERSLIRSLGLDARSDSARQALYMLAEISLQRDTWTTVEGMLDTLAAARPYEAEAQYWLGRMAQKRSQDGVAEDRFRKAASLAPERVRYSEALAALAFAKEDCDKALRILRPQRMRLDGDGLSVYGECLLQGNKPKEAALEFEKLYDAHPNAATQTQWAKALIATGQTARTIAMLKASPHAKSPEAQKVLALAYLEADSAEAARDLLKPLSAASPNDAELHYLLGRCSFALRDYAWASKELTEAVRYREDYPDAVYQQGLCLLKLGRAGEAHHYFDELADSPRKSWKAKGMLGRGQAFAQEGKLEAAQENLENSYKLIAGADAAANLALTLLRMNKVEDADGWAAKARQADADNPLSVMATVDVLLEQHKEPEALAKAAAGLSAHPGSCDFVLVAAKANLRAGHDGEAKELSLRARDLCPSEPTPYYYLGSLSARAGTTSDARQQFETYVRNGGDARKVPQSYR